MKKRVTALLLCCCLFMSLAGCGEGKRYREAMDLMAAGEYAEAGEIFEELGEYKDSAEQRKLALNELHYAEAAALLDQGQYADAGEAFTALGDFGDSAEMALECLYREAGALCEQERYEEAIPLYEELGEYKDSADLVLGTRYQLADALLQSGRYDRAAALLRELGDYRDCRQKLAEAEKILEAQYQIGQAEVGSIVYFGRYEQDGDAADGAEDIAWVLLDKSDGRALLLCRDGLDCRKFQDSFVTCRWDGSSLRSWLNGEFLNDAFDESERRRILNTVIEGEDNPRYGTDGGGESVCAVFALSTGEAERYLAGQKKLAATLPSDVAGALEAGRPNGNCCWWLRTPGYSGKYCAYVDSEGVISYEGMYCDNRHFTVRPALYLALTDERMPETMPAISEPAPLPENEETLCDLDVSVDMGQEYINNIIFLGDSTTFGLREIDMPARQLWTGVAHTMSLYEQSYIKVICGRRDYIQGTIREAVEHFKPEMMIITLGMRQLSMMNEELFKSEYRDLVTGIQEVSPETKIILNSIFPVAAKLDRSVVNFTNDMVSTTNSWVHDIAEETGVHYLDSYSLLLDEDGYMVAEYAKGDGLHMLPLGLNTVLDIYRTHAYN